MLFTQLAPKQLLSSLVDATKAVPEVPPMDLSADDEKTYNTLAKKLEVLTRPERQTRAFRVWLSQQGIACYNPRRVRDYLDKELGRASKDHWCWRAANRRSGEGDGMLPARFVGAIMAHRHGGIRSYYMEPIPLPVLLTMERVLAAFPGAKFFVSDRVTREERQGLLREAAIQQLRAAQDPFLLCAVEYEMYIIERWDEPRFRG